MAKREVPEINAGSMADIAFLLLIFFLVTTTMDKDQAYIRTIPKLLENPPPPPPIQKRDVLEIQANQQNRLMVRGQIIEPDDISEKVKEFYLSNRRVNDLKSDFPLYSDVTISFMEAEIDRVTKEVEDLEAQAATDMATYKRSMLTEMEKKLKALKLYKKSPMREISSQANIRIKTQQLTSYSLFTKIQSEIQEALYDLRNEESMELFGISYGVLKKRAETNLEDKESADRVELLKILFPDRIIEVTPG